MSPSWWINFGLGCLGSVAIEIVDLIKIFESGKRMPARYRRWQYWILRVALVAIAGLMAAALDPPGPLWAIGIGVAAPSVLKDLGRRVPGDDRTEKK